MRRLRSLNEVELIDGGDRVGASDTAIEGAAGEKGGNDHEKDRRSCCPTVPVHSVDYPCHNSPADLDFPLLKEAQRTGLRLGRNTNVDG